MIDLRENIVSSLGEILLHKLRSFLTILGIIFGVASVIAMMSIGKGAQQASLKQIESMGAKNITVKSKKIMGKKLLEAKRRFSKGLSIDDSIYIKKNIKGIKEIAPVMITRKNVAYGKLQPEANLVGVGDEYFRILNKASLFGRTLTLSDVKNYRRVCVLGYGISKKIFHNEDPVGKLIKIGGVRYVIAGVMGDMTLKTNTATGSGIDIQTRDMNNDIYIPRSLINNIYEYFKVNSPTPTSDNDPDYHQVSEMIIQAESMETIPAIKELINKALKRRHGNTEDFEIIIPIEKLAQKKETQRIFNIVMTGIAAISLIVGGIGIMNIMLASVSERIREIGIRRAIGATRRDIMLQFITESFLLSLIGGLLGIFLGIVISYVVSAKADWQTVITWWSVIMAFAVSALTGIISGIFPAYRAANMDPVECLRYE
ncbi:MAG: hypothetical protein C0601_10030 [Candidatus Muiribacterium halophilum]|uniref:ABC transporter permease n=1 Tax=Muiribacterium halophilum TaxID=2053465 RepID=A0A2N5ZD21_MUIH1|nr:MAG: hypothetical protein C0601_10030 [Candidatus Muirbacterium halophilum]